MGPPQQKVLKGQESLGIGCIDIFSVKGKKPRDKGLSKIYFKLYYGLLGNHIFGVPEPYFCSVSQFS